MTRLLAILVALAVQSAAGMWTEVIPSNAFKAAQPTDAQLEAWSAGGVGLRGVVGPSSVLTKWNSVSFDPAAGCVYAMGGGHEDYGGNEVYQACIGGTWQRLTDPSPYTGELINTAADGTEYRLPLTGPPSVHTYGGAVYHPTLHALIFTAYSSHYSRWWQQYPYPAVPYNWAFDIAGKTWTRIPVDYAASMGFSVFVPTTGKVYAVGRNEVQTVIDGDLKATWIRYQPKAAQHVAEYDSVRDVVWSSDTGKGSLVQWSVAPGRLTRVGSTAIPLEAREAMGGHAAIAERAGVLWFFGGRQVVTFDPESTEWRVIPRPTEGPSNNLAYRKFFYWPPEDKFVAVSDNGAVWLLDPGQATGDPVDDTKMRAEVRGKRYATIAAAAAALNDGDTLTIYPGEYAEGFKVSANDVMVQASGVTITETTGGKAAVVQLGSRLTVVGLAARGLQASDGNASLVRMEPGADSLTLRSVKISDSQGGFVLTGNKPTGVILVQDSLGERNGNGGQAHGIYTGYGIAQTVCRYSQVVGGRGAGHLWKSRSQDNLIDGCTLDGLDTHHSRVIDIPCGGVLHVRNSTLRQSPGADNRDLIAVGVEACREYASRPQPWASKVIFENATVIATKQNARLFTTKEPLEIECRGQNTFEGIDSPCPAGPGPEPEPEPGPTLESRVERLERAFDKLLDTWGSLQ